MPDNGIYILETAGPEYRVVHAEDIENIYGSFNDDTGKWTGDPEKIIEYFGKSKVFNDINMAMDEADVLSSNIDWVEDGICLIRDFSDNNFGDLYERRE